MARASRPWLAASIALLFASGCAERAPLAEPQVANALAELSAPLDVVEFEVASVGNRRGIFLKLSRLPDSLTHRTEENPAQIVLEIAGPTGEESPEEAFPGSDDVVRQLRVSRTFGVLRVAIVLQADEVPEYSVHQMADYIMIRLGPTS